jgi:hypothetical protein
MPSQKLASRSGQSQKQAVALDAIVPKPFLNSLFSYPSFGSMFGDSKTESSGRLRSASQSNSILGKSRSGQQVENTYQKSKSSYDLCLNSSPDLSIGKSAVQMDEYIGLKILNLELLEIAVEPYLASNMDRRLSLTSNQTAFGDNTFLLNSIIGVFSNLDTLAASFQEPLEETPHPSNLNISSICASYDIIIHLHPADLFKMKLIHAIEITLAKLYLHVKSNQNPELSILRVLLILLLVFKESLTL